MRPSRWPILGAIALLAAISATAAGTAAARSPTAADTSPPACTDASMPTSGRPMSGAWWRLDPVLDGTGTLVGQVLRAGQPGGPRHRLRLPAESFASGSSTGRVLIGADDGSSSAISILDLGLGCVHPIARERAVIRRAIADHDGTSAYEFRVDRGTRADLGVWRRDLTASAPPRLILGPLASDERFGITWSTELVWSDDGRLLVASCGAIACRVRIVDPKDGSVTTVADPDVGEPIGVADGRLVSYLACRGLPCPIVTIDLRDGSRKALVRAAGVAALGHDGAAAVLVHQQAGDRTINVITLPGSTVRRIEVDEPLLLVGPPGRTGSGVELLPGWVAVAAGGRIGQRGTADAIRLRDGRTLSAAEVAP